MERTLVMLEVSQKQDYIFASKKLRINAARSSEIAQITGSRFFRDVGEGNYNESENLVYTGGGHAVLQFSSRERAVLFNRVVTEAVLRRYRGLDLFAVCMAYDTTKTPGENLKTLTKKLERKKAVRASGFCRKDFGMESAALEVVSPKMTEDAPQRYKGYSYPSLQEELLGDDPFLAVVHLDGNAMGERLGKIYAENTDWNDCCRALRAFSDSVQRDFTVSFHETVDIVIQQGGVDKTTKLLPIRPILLAGDDVCFVTAGRIGLECARVFLERLSVRGWSACGGVAFVPLKYPFHMAYDLAEELCASAKKFVYQQDPASRISAIDWHIVLGTRQESLASVRERYKTDDGACLTLRPVNVVVPNGNTGPRSYDAFRTMYRYLERHLEAIGRGTLKDLRGALKQGEVESRFFLNMHGLAPLLEDCLFTQIGGVRHSRCFDAVELLERCSFFEEGWHEETE